MRKNVIAIIGLLVILSVLGACSNNDKKSEKSSETVKKSSGKVETKKESATDPLYDDIDDALTAGFSKGCNELALAYGNFQTAGNSSDGIGEITSIEDVPFNNTLLLNENIAKIKYADNQTDELLELQSDLEAAYQTADGFYRTFFDIGSSDLLEASDRDAKVAKLHTTVAEYRAFVNDLGYGPCE